MCVIVEVAAAPIDSRMWVEIDWIMLGCECIFWGAFAEFWRFPLKRFFLEWGKVLIDSLLRFEEDYELGMMNEQELERANDLELGFDMDLA